MKKMILLAAGVALLVGCSPTPSSREYTQMNNRVPVYYKGRKAPRHYTVIKTEKTQQMVANNATPQRKLTRKDFSAPRKMSIYALQQAALRNGANAVVDTSCVAHVTHDRMNATVICQGKLARVRAGQVRRVHMAKTKTKMRVMKKAAAKPAARAQKSA